MDIPLYPTGDALEGRCPVCVHSGSLDGIGPGHARSVTGERLWRCPRCEGVSVQIPVARRVALLVVVGGFALMLASSLGTGAWIAWVVALGDVPAGFLVISGILCVVGGWGSRRAVRSIRRLVRSPTLIPANYDAQRGRWILEGTV